MTGEMRGGENLERERGKEGGGSLRCPSSGYQATHLIKGKSASVVCSENKGE